MQVRPQSFPISGGQCKVFSDRVTVEQKSPFILLVNKWFGGKLKPVYAILASILALGAIAGWLIQNYFIAFFLLCFSVYFLFILFKDGESSVKLELLKSQIESVVYMEPVPGKSRGEFEIYFLENEKRYRRKISLATGGKQGLMIAQGAYHIFRDAGLIDKPDKAV